jgi:hypothetical protein
MMHSLHDVTPIYTAVFTFADQAGDLRLTKAWHDPHGKAAYEERDRSWIRLDRGTTEPSSLFDVSLCNLQEDGSQWHFGLTNAQKVEDARLPEYLKVFAETVILDEEAACNDIGDLFFTYRGDVGLKTLQQRKSYRYGLINSDYTLELTRFQDRSGPR